MARWKLQSDVSSITPAARSRTAYLRPLLDDVVRAIHEYFRNNPTGEEVTLAVLAAIGRDRLEGIAGRRSFGRAKQDLGLFVAQTLVDLFEARYVATLRRDDDRSVSARRNTWPNLEWVNSFAPHKVLRPQPPVDRILLDAVVVRKVIHGDQDALDVASLISVKGNHPVSIADGAMAEISLALLRGSVRPEEWSARIGQLDGLLDPEFPIAPGGNDLAAFWGARPMVGHDIDEIRTYYQASWRHVRGIKTVADLSKPTIFHSPSGRAYSLKSDLKNVEAVIADVGRKWSEWVNDNAAVIKELRDRGDNLTETDLQRLKKSDLVRDMGVADVEKLDLLIQVMAKRAMQAASESTPYDPKGKPNDPFDLDLLFGIPLPAWVCTSDDRLIRLVRSTTSPDRFKVMTPEELIERLQNEAREHNDQ